MSDAANAHRTTRCEALRAMFASEADQHPDLEAVVCFGNWGWRGLNEYSSPRSVRPSLRNLLKNPYKSGLVSDRLWATDGVDGMVEWEFRLYNTTPGKEDFFGLDGFRATTPAVQRYCVLADRACRALALRPILVRGTPPVEWLVHIASVSPPLTHTAVKLTWAKSTDLSDTASGEWVEVDVGPEPARMAVKRTEIERLKDSIHEFEIGLPGWWAVGLGNLFEASAAAIERAITDGNVDGEAFGTPHETDLSGDPSHGGDFEWVMWDGREFTFCPRERPVIRALWEAWSTCRPALSHSVLLDAAGSNGNRLRDVFKNNGKVNDAWMKLVVKVKGTRDLYRLAFPPNPGQPR